MSKISDKTLYDFCVLYRQQFGAVEDAVRFRNELGLRYYWHTRDADELYRRCIRCRIIEEKAGNVIFKVNPNGRDKR